MKDNKLWQGRFQEATDTLVERFNASIDFDKRMHAEDIAASRAHATMLGECGIISQADASAIILGLGQVEQEITNGEMQWLHEREDIHMHIEARLTELIGDTGKKLHTARSRNDQVATDIRLWLRNAADRIGSQIVDLLEQLALVAEREHATIMPGFTHLQIAQPITFGHHMLAWFAMLERDLQRLQNCRVGINQLPLGSAALAGTSYPINRQQVADALGFEGLCSNSLDAVSDRDFAIEFCSFASLTMMHMSRWSEEMILWASPLVGFIALPDSVCTGSSIMPQKKNPDVPELIRGKTSRVYASLTHLLTLMKAQPLAYNKDNQEDKEPLFDTVDTLSDCLQLMTLVISKLTVNADTMRKAFVGGYATATDLADYLVKQGLPFRDAHEQVGQLVALAIKSNKELEQLSLSKVQSCCPLAERDVFAILSLEGSLKSRTSYAGTAPDQVLARTHEAQQFIQLLRN